MLAGGPSEEVARLVTVCEYEHVCNRQSRVWTPTSVCPCLQHTIETLGHGSVLSCKMCLESTLHLECSGKTVGS